jgi:hypothetical protein
MAIYELQLQQLKILSLLSLKSKWLETMVGMLKVDFFVLPCPKHVQLLIKTILQGKIQLITSSQLIQFK